MGSLNFSLLLSLFFFLFGCIIGSFLNVVILRFNTGLSIANGRSRCFSCNKDLRWYELVPVLSYLAVRGKCARCKSKISIQYILVELATGVTFVLIYLKFQYLAFFPATHSISSGLISSSLSVFFIALAYYFFIAALLIVIFVYDLRHKIIPDTLVAIFIVLTFLRLFTAVPQLWAHGTLSDFWAGPVIALPFFLLWLASRGRWMGLGDAKLALPIGWMLGMQRGVSAVVFAF